MLFTSRESDEFKRNGPEGPFRFQEGPTLSDLDPRSVTVVAVTAARLAPTVTFAQPVVVTINPEVHARTVGRTSTLSVECACRRKTHERRMHQSALASTELNRRNNAQSADVVVLEREHFQRQLWSQKNEGGDSRSRGILRHRHRRCDGAEHRMKSRPVRTRRRRRRTSTSSRRTRWPATRAPAARLTACQASLTSREQRRFRHATPGASSALNKPKERNDGERQCALSR